jgi:ABC-type sulfate transport system permease component
VIYANIESDAPESAASLSVVLLAISLIVLVILRWLGARNAS